MLSSKSMKTAIQFSHVKSLPMVSATRRVSLLGSGLSVKRKFSGPGHQQFKRYSTMMLSHKKPAGSVLSSSLFRKMKNPRCGIADQIRLYNSNHKLECISQNVNISVDAKIHYLEYPKIGCANESFKRSSAKSDLTLVCLHGSYQSAYTFDDLIEKMDEMNPMRPLRVISIDLRGHGDSSWSPNGIYTLESLRNDVSKVLDALDVENYYILGNGLGSLVALDCASSRHFTADLLGVIPIEVPSSPKKLRAFDAMRYNASFSSFEKFVDFLLDLNPNTTESSVRKRLQQAIRENPISGKFEWKRDPRFNFDTDVFQSDIELLVSKITGLASDTRVLVVRGENSQVSSEVSTEKLLDTINDGVENESRKAHAISLPGGHVLHGDAPRMLAEQVLKFMRLL